MTLSLIKDNQKGKTYQADGFQFLYRKAGSMLWDNAINVTETLYFITGAAEISIEEQKFMVEAPVKVVIPEKTYHRIEAKSDISFILFT